MNTNADLTVVPAWRKDNAKLEADAVSFWRSEGILPAEIDPAVRAKELVTIAYLGDRPVALLTAAVTNQTMGHSFAFTRIGVAAEFRRRGISVRVTRASFRTLADWAMAHPEARLAGTRTSYESHVYRNRKSPGVSKNAALVLVGYNKKGYEIRVRWFDHFRV